MKFVSYFVLATLAIAGTQATDPTCGGDVSPNLDIVAKDPGANKNCTWHISTNKSQVVIRFSGLNLDASVYNLTVLGINDTNITPIANVTQYQGSVHVVSGFNVTLIVFSRNDKGLTSLTFTANITDECIEVISKSIGVINSPVYIPNSVPITCSYLVTMGTLDNVFVLSFSKFFLPNGTLTTQFGSQQSKPWSGTTLPPVLVGSKDESLKMTLKIDDVEDNQSFAADFRIADARCSGAITAADTTTNITFPTANNFPIICYAQFSTLNKKNQLLAVDNGRSSQLSGVDSIVFYDGLTFAAPIAGNIAEGLHSFVSSGEYLTMVANLGISMLRSDTIMVRQDAFSRLFHLTNETVPWILNGTLVDGKDVQLQFSSEHANQKIMIDLSSNTSLTFATVTIADAMDAPMVTFNSDSVLFPVVIPINRAIVTIRNLTDTQYVTIEATAVNNSDCNQLYTADPGDMSFSAPSSATTCTIAIVTAKHLTLALSSVNLCANSSLDIYDGFSKTSHTIATLSITSVNLNIPQINFNKGNGARLVWKGNNSCSNTTLTGRYFAQGVADNWCGNLGQGTITTPHFPNQYPLNVQSTCPIPISSSNVTAFTYFSFLSVQMLSGHSVSIQSNDTTVFTLNDSSLPLLDRIETGVNFSVTFNSLTKGQDLEQTGQGVKMNYEFLDCGQSVNDYNGTLTSPVNQSATCIWIISTLPNDTKTAYIVNASFIANNPDNTGLKDFLEIRDGGSSRAPQVSNFKSNAFLSTSNALWVKYRCEIKSESTDCAGLSIKYTTYNCTELCANGMCMKPGWRCDGLLQCTDGSDEFNCTAPPPPPPPMTTSAPVPPEKPKGIAGYWIFVCLVIGFIAGIILTIFVPRCINSLRGRGQNSNYGTLHEEA